MFFATLLMASAVCSGVICFNDVILVPAEAEGLFSVFDIKLDSNLCYKRNTLVGCTDTATKTGRKHYWGLQIKEATQWSCENGQLEH